MDACPFPLPAEDSDLIGSVEHLWFLKKLLMILMCNQDGDQLLKTNDSLPLHPTALDGQSLG